MQQHLLFLLTQSPTTSELAVESLDAVVTAALFDQDVEVVLIEDGIEWLNSESAVKGYDKLEMIVSMENCGLYALSIEDAHPPKGAGEANTYRVKSNLSYQVISVDELKNKMNDCDKILSF